MCPQLEKWPSEPLGEAGWPLCFGVLPGEHCCSFPGGARCSPDSAPGAAQEWLEATLGLSPVAGPMEALTEPHMPCLGGEATQGIRSQGACPSSPGEKRRGHQACLVQALVQTCRPPWRVCWDAHRGSCGAHMLGTSGPGGGGTSGQGGPSEGVGQSSPSRERRPPPIHPQRVCGPARPAYSPHPAFSDGKFPRQQQHKL